MNAKMLSLLAGAAMVAGIGTASAGDPLKLTADDMDGVTAGWCSYCFSKYVDLNERTRVDIAKRVDIHVNITGNFAGAEAVADAFGDNSDAQTFTQTLADDYYSGAYSQSSSSVD